MLVVWPRAASNRSRTEDAAHLLWSRLFDGDRDCEPLVREPLHPAIRPRAETTVPDVEHVIGLRTEVAENPESVAEPRERQVDGCTEDASRIVARSCEARIGKTHSTCHSADGERASDNLERALAARAMIEQLLARDFNEIAVPPSEPGR